MVTAVMASIGEDAQSTYGNGYGGNGDGYGDGYGNRHEGYLLVWTPRSRDDNNGGDGGNGDGNGYGGNGNGYGGNGERVPAEMRSLKPNGHPLIVDVDSKADGNGYGNGW